MIDTRNAESVDNHGVRRSLSSCYRYFARAVIESALMDRDVDFFLNSDSVFPLMARTAEVDPTTLRKYAREELAELEVFRRKPGRACPLRIVFSDGREWTFGNTREAVRQCHIDEKTLRRARKGRGAWGHRARTQRGFIEVYPVIEVGK